MHLLPHKITKNTIFCRVGYLGWIMSALCILSVQSYAQLTRLTVHALTLDSVAAEGKIILMDNAQSDSIWESPLEEGIAVFQLNYVGNNPFTVDEEVHIFPNPATGSLRISTGELNSLVWLKITDSFGREILFADNPDREINLQAKPGIYFILFKTIRGLPRTTKVVLTEPLTRISLDRTYSGPAKKSTGTGDFTLYFQDPNPMDPELAPFNQQISILPFEEKNLTLRLEYSSKDFFIQGKGSPGAFGSLKNYKREIGTFRINEEGFLLNTRYEAPFSKTKGMNIQIEMFDEYSNIIEIQQQVFQNSIIEIDTSLSYRFVVEGGNCSPPGADIHIWNQGQIQESTSLSTDGSFRFLWNSNQKSQVIDSIVVSRKNYHKLIISDTLLNAGNNALSFQLSLKAGHMIQGYVINETAEHYIDRGTIELTVNSQLYECDVTKSGTFSFAIDSSTNIADSVSIRFINHPDYSNNTFSILRQDVPAATGKITGGIHLPYHINKVDAVTSLESLLYPDGIYMVAFSDSAAKDHAIYQYLNGGFSREGIISYPFDTITLVLDTIRDYQNTPVQEEIRDRVMNAFSFLQTHYVSPLGVRLVHSKVIQGLSGTGLDESVGKAYLTINTSPVPHANFYPPDSKEWLTGYATSKGFDDAFDVACLLGCGLNRGISYLPPFTEFENNDGSIPVQTWFGRLATRTAYLFPAGFFSRSYEDYHLIEFALLNGKGIRDRYTIEGIAGKKLEAEDGQIFDLYHGSDYKGSLDRRLAIPSYYQDHQLFTYHPSRNASSIEVFATVVQSKRLPLASAFHSPLQVSLGKLKMAGVFIWIPDSSVINNDTLWSLVNPEMHLQWSFLDSTQSRSKSYSIIAVDNEDQPISTELGERIQHAVSIFRPLNDVPFQIMKTEVDTLFEYPDSIPGGRIAFIVDNRVERPIVEKRMDGAYSYIGALIRVPPDVTSNGLVMALAEAEGLHIENQTDLNSAFSFDKGQIDGLEEPGVLALRIIHLFKAGVLRGVNE